MADLQHALYPRYSQPGFSRLVQRMETDGLVRRERDRHDGRAIVVVTTRKGRRDFERANRVYVDALRVAFGRHLQPDEHAALVQILGTAMSARARSADLARSG
jgi:DNA-binding MarR family transcriptional regulator